MNINYIFNDFDKFLIVFAHIMEDKKNLMGQIDEKRGISTYLIRISNATVCIFNLAHCDTYTASAYTTELKVNMYTFDGNKK